MVCEACGYENRVGNRFCGMCGTPLPHRPLTAPGAQGTHSLTRVPQESTKPAVSPPTGSPADKPSLLPPSSRTGVLIKMPNTDLRGSQASQPGIKARDMVPAVPLDEYVRTFCYVPPADSEEITMRGEAPVLNPGAPAMADHPAIAPAGPGTSMDTSTVPPIEDVRERLGLEDALGEDRRDRPRFLDFSESPALTEDHAPPASTVVGRSVLGLSDAPKIGPEPTAETQTSKPSRETWRIWFAVAVLLVVAVLGALEWRSQVNQTNDGPVEVIKMRIQNMRGDDTPAPQSAATADTKAAEQEMQVQEQPKAQMPDQNAAANPNVAGSTSANGRALTPETTAGTHAGNPPQNITPATGDQPSAAHKAVPPAQGPSVNGSQSAAEHNASKQKATPPASASNSGPAPAASDVGQPATEKAKPGTQAGQRDDDEVAVVPGEEEMAKAKNASDSAAAAAWLWKATAKGNPEAPVRLADMYIKGAGVPRNCEQALVLLKTAATKENPRASNRLASLYTSGTCVQRNRVQAYRWLSATLVADPNSHWAQQTRELLWRQMTPEERTAVEDYR